MLFTYNELRFIREIGEELGLVNAEVARQSSNNPNFRKSMISWIHPTDGNIWMFERITSEFKNHPGDIKELQSLQYTVYNKGGYYDWHIDRPVSETQGDPIAKRRVVTAVLQLSRPSEYEGGDLYVKRRGDQEIEEKIEKEYGKLVIFPSNLSHMVSKVTKGTRRTLVFWGLTGKEDI